MFYSSRIVSWFFAQENRERFGEFLAKSRDFTRLPRRWDENQLGSQNCWVKKTSSAIIIDFLASESIITIVIIIIIIIP